MLFCQEPCELRHGAVRISALGPRKGGFYLSMSGCPYSRGPILWGPYSRNPISVGPLSLLAPEFACSTYRKPEASESNHLWTPRSMSRFLIIVSTVRGRAGDFCRIQWVRRPPSFDEGSIGRSNSLTERAGERESIPFVHPATITCYQQVYCNSEDLASHFSTESFGRGGGQDAYLPI